MSSKCKYDSTRVGFIDENGRRQSYAHCTLCGKWHKGQYGVIFDFNTPDHMAAGRIKLCSKCAKRLTGDLVRLYELLSDTSGIKDDNSKTGKRCEEVLFNFHHLDFSDETEEE